MLKRSQAVTIILVIVIAQILGACIMGDEASGEPASVSRVVASPTARVTSTATPTATVTTSAARPTASELPATTSSSAEVEPSRVPATITPSIGYYKKDEIPAGSACDEDTVINLFEEFVRRYNAEDLDGLMDMIQVDLPGSKNAGGAPATFNREGEVEFDLFSMSMHGHDELNFIAHDHEGLRAAFAKRFAVDDRLRLTHVIIAPATTFVNRDSFPGAESGTYISQRNAVVGPRFEERSTVSDLHEIRGKGVIDCVSGKIIRLSVGG